MIGPILVSILVIRLTYHVFSDSATPGKLNVLLNIYKDSSVYYRIGDNSFKNLEPKFVVLSKKNQATVIETSPSNNIISGKV